MGFVKEVIKEAAKRRGMSYDGLISYIKRERNKGTSAGLGEISEGKEDEAVEVSINQQDVAQTQANETSSIKSNCPEIAQEAEQTTEMPQYELKTTGSIGNFGKQSLVFSQTGSNGERLGKMAAEQSNHPYFQ